jgi:hypothetical protein
LHLEVLEEMTEKMNQNTTENMMENMKEVNQVEAAKYLEAMAKEANDGSGTKGTHGVKGKSFGRGIELADTVK